MKLVRYSEISEHQYLDYIQEWELSREKIVPIATERRDKSFQELLTTWQRDETDIVYDKGFVPATLYFFIDEENRIIGAIHQRHELNDQLLQHGGHIGYGIRPSARRKGYASIMLSILLNKLWKQGFSKILIMCDDDNVASSKTIEKNHGEFIDKSIFEGTLIRKYWIYTPNLPNKNDA